MSALGELLGESPKIEATKDQIRRLLRRIGTTRRPPPLLLRGETGTGKGLVARAVHREGPRAPGPFVSLNCAALPETLIEAELFGFERGAFTDARQPKPGLFRLAHGGTFLLDEVALLPRSAQGKVLSVLEESMVRRLGGTRTEPVDIWLIAATNANLEQAVATGEFREDLYHRLAVVTIALPPLRDRGADVWLLAEKFLQLACDEYGLPQRSLADDARVALLQYSWPGNVRELANVIRRALLASDDPTITAAALGLSSRPAASQPVEAIAAADPDTGLRQSVDRIERERLLETLNRMHWNVARAADELGMPRNSLRYRIAKHGLRPDDGLVLHRRRSLARSIQPSAAATHPSPARDKAWERRLVTVLRIGLGSPGADGTDPWWTADDFEGFVEKIEGFGGRVVRREPDGIDALFGLGVDEEAPVHAANAALAIRLLVQRLRSRGRLVPSMVAAIHSAPSFVSLDGSAPRISEESLRALQRAAAELVRDAEPDGLLVSPGTAPLIQRRFQFEMRAQPS